MEICIVANGEFPTRESVLQVLREADMTVCCDGAFTKYIAWRRAEMTYTGERDWAYTGERSYAVVGDCDSITEDTLAEAKRLGLSFDYCRVEEQEYNDLTKAVRYAMQHVREAGVEEQDCGVTIVGATGLREDHTLGNIGLLAWYRRQYPGVRFRMLTDHGVLYPVEGNAVFETYPGQQVSIISLTPSVPVSVKGLRWPIEERCLDWWWQGTLNEALGEQFEVQGGTLLVMLLARVGLDVESDGEESSETMGEG